MRTCPLVDATSIEVNIHSDGLMAVSIVACFLSGLVVGLLISTLV